jgi:hypothetical protein
VQSKVWSFERRLNRRNLNERQLLKRYLAHAQSMFEWGQGFFESMLKYRNDEYMVELRDRSQIRSYEHMRDVGGIKTTTEDGNSHGAYRNSIRQ